ncbi:MAG: PAS domain S-box protein [Coleofasciculus sp. S288]|nr:PAS domain S-box protein [Coleofasciculus sp. S288]
MFRLLLIDDNLEDRVLILRELNREFLDLQAEEIIEPEGFHQAISAGNFDFVITDYQLRWTNGITVLEEVKSRYPNCPVIMFTDSGSQEVAVEAMKKGLDDYLVKSLKHYIRLPVAVRTVLQQTATQQRADRLELRLQTLLNQLNVGVFRSRLDGCLLEGNAAFLHLLGVSSLQAAQTLDLQELFRQPTAELQSLNQGREVQLRRADGSFIWVSLNQTINTTDSEPVIEGLIENISDRKLAQEALKCANDELELRVAERTQELQQANEQLLVEIGERKQAQLALQQSAAYHRHLVEVCPDPIFIQCGGQFVFVNEAAIKLYGATNSSELIGKRVFDYLHPDYHEIVKQRIQQLRDTGKPMAMMEQKFFRLDGTVIDVEVAAAPFTYQKQPAAQVVVHDISDRKRAEAELRKALETERELSELKSRIITTISHEYRTPLATILSSAELLRTYGHKFTEEKRLTHLHRIETSSQHLTNLVSDVLFIGQADADRLKFNPAPLDLEQFCQELVEEMSFSTRNQRAIAFSTRGKCTRTCLDEKLLRQILTNLLSNAIKYSPPESTLGFDLECAESTVVLSIRDEGIGIPAQHLPQLFESFHRADNVGTIPGTGLGLAIVKKCVDMHGGQINVESIVDVGTTVTVMLPTFQEGVRC